MNNYARISQKLRLTSVVGILALGQAYAETADGLNYTASYPYGFGMYPPEGVEITGHANAPVELQIPEQLSIFISYPWPGSEQLLPVVSIGERAFANSTSLAKIILPNTLKRIEQSAFAGCTSLASVTLPESLNGIESNTFEGCTSLTQITLPNETNYIGWGAFEGCENLATINIGDDFNGVGDQY